MTETASTRAAVWPARRAWIAVLALLGWCALVRLPLTLKSVDDWDESLYLLMADQWANGHPPYTAVWDHKPIGIYAIFRVGLAIFGHTVVSIRALSTLFVFFGALSVGGIAHLAFKSRRAAWAAAIAYPLFMLTCGGTAANTEIFFIALNLVGAWLLLRTHHEDPSGLWRWAHVGAAGLLFGAALQVKYLALFEQAFFLVLFFSAARRRASGIAAPAAVIAATLVAPTLAASAYFWSCGEWRVFVEANFAANVRHAGSQTLFSTLAKLAVHTFSWLVSTSPVWIAAILTCLLRAAPTARWAPPDRAARLLLAWTLVGIVEASATRMFYLHYYLVTIPPLCLLIAWIIVQAGIDRRPIAIPIAASLLLGFIPLATVFQDDYIGVIRQRLGKRRDTSAEVSAFLRQRLSPGEAIYVVDDQPIIYFLSGARLPTKYVFPPFLMNAHFSKVAGVDYRAEIQRIVAGRPRCVVVQDDDNPRAKEVRALLDGTYATERRYGTLEVLCRS